LLQPRVQHGAGPLYSVQFDPRFDDLAAINQRCPSLADAALD
jgi:hypothetical protein